MQTVIVIDTDDPQGIIDTIAILHNLDEIAGSSAHSMRYNKVELTNLLCRFSAEAQEASVGVRYRGGPTTLSFCKSYVKKLFAEHD